MKSIIKYTLLTALRDWLFFGIFVIAIIFSMLSVFLGNTALTEQKYMSTIYIAGLNRMTITIGLILFICFHVRRAFDHKEIELTLSRPITRFEFILSYYFGFAVLSLILVLTVMSFLMGLALMNFIVITVYGWILWGISLYLEVLIITAFAFFIALFVRSAVFAVMLTLGFYFMARIFGFFLISINNIASITKTTKLGSISEKVLDVLGIVFPRLDMYSQSEWLIYGLGDLNIYGNGNFATSIALLVVISGIYIALILSLALFDFIRKQF